LTDEIERIRQAYRERDASSVTDAFSYQNPAFAFHMRERESAILAALRQMNFSLQGAKVLEVGCGTGHILQRFIEFGAAQAWGIELMENRVAIANRSYPDLRITQGNAAALPYEDGSFDVVMQFMCISSVLDGVVRKQIATEMWRTLKPGGIFLSYDLRPPSWAYTFPRALVGKVLPDTVKNKIRQRRAQGTGHVTPIKPLGLDEIGSWSLGRDGNIYSLSLAWKWVTVAQRHALLERILALLPWLRTAYLVVLRKPLT
jgi:ubiquinone/menaquinone biosynthesis C-methylase UbiE